MLRKWALTAENCKVNHIQAHIYWGGDPSKNAKVHSIWYVFLNAEPDVLFVLNEKILLGFYWFSSVSAVQLDSWTVLRRNYVFLLRNRKGYVLPQKASMLHLGSYNICSLKQYSRLKLKFGTTYDRLQDVLCNACYYCATLTLQKKNPNCQSSQKPKYS